MSALKHYDIIMPRKPLSVLINCAMNDFDTFAFRPYEGSPLMIDRTSSYSTNPGSVGMLFESFLISQPKKQLHRTYGICKVELSNAVNILVTAEIDAIDSETGSPVEIKTKPAWANSRDRALQTWAQASIANVQTIVTGSWERGRGDRHGPVTFQTERNIEYQTLDNYGQYIQGKVDGLENAVEVLRVIMNTCTDVGCVYRVSGSRDGSLVTCKKISSDNGSLLDCNDLSTCPEDCYKFPMSKKMIELIAEVVLAESD